MKQAMRFNISNLHLCPALRWKGMFTAVEEDVTVPSTRDNHYWCVYTQACIGPDNKLAEPDECSSLKRKCRREALASLR
jgi:hypothetical protein